MRKLIYLLIIIILFSSCRGKILRIGGLFPYKQEEMSCFDSIEDYSLFEHEFFKKNIDTIIGKDTLYSADVLFVIKEIPDTSQLASYLNIFCYCLNICKKYSLSDARFYNTLIGFELAQDYNISEFTEQNIKFITSNEIKSNYRDFLCSFRIPNLDSSFIQAFNSDNITTPDKEAKLSNFEKKITYKLLIE